MLAENENNNLIYKFCKKQLKKDIFISKEGFYYCLNDKDQAILVKPEIPYQFEGKNIVIPKTLDEHLLIGVGPEAFKEIVCDSIVFKGDLYFICSEAFLDSKFHFIKLPNKVGTIDAGAFGFSTLKKAIKNFYEITNLHFSFVVRMPNYIFDENEFYSKDSLFIRFVKNETSLIKYCNTTIDGELKFNIKSKIIYIEKGDSQITYTLLDSATFKLCESDNVLIHEKPIESVDSFSIIYSLLPKTKLTKEFEELSDEEIERLPINFKKFNILDLYPKYLDIDFSQIENKEFLIKFSSIKRHSSFSITYPLSNKITFKEGEVNFLEGIDFNDNLIFIPSKTNLFSNGLFINKNKLIFSVELTKHFTLLGKYIEDSIIDGIKYILVENKADQKNRFFYLAVGLFNNVSEEVFSIKSHINNVCVKYVYLNAYDIVNSLEIEDSNYIEVKIKFYNGIKNYNIKSANKKIQNLYKLFPQINNSDNTDISIENGIEEIENANLNYKYLYFSDVLNRSSSSQKYTLFLPETLKNVGNNSLLVSQISKIICYKGTVFKDCALPNNVILTYLDEADKEEIVKNNLLPNTNEFAEVKSANSFGDENIESVTSLEYNEEKNFVFNAFFYRTSVRENLKPYSYEEFIKNEQEKRILSGENLYNNDSKTNNNQTVNSSDFNNEQNNKVETKDNLTEKYGRKNDGIKKIINLSKNKNENLSVENSFKDDTKKNIDLSRKENAKVKEGISKLLKKDANITKIKEPQKTSKETIKKVETQKSKTNKIIKNNPAPSPIKTTNTSYNNRAIKTDYNSHNKNSQVIYNNVVSNYATNNAINSQKNYKGGWLTIISLIMCVIGFFLIVTINVKVFYYYQFYGTTYEIQLDDESLLSSFNAFIFIFNAIVFLFGIVGQLGSNKIAMRVLSAIANFVFIIMPFISKNQIISQHNSTLTERYVFDFGNNFTIGIIFFVISLIFLIASIIWPFTKIGGAKKN